MENGGAMTGRSVRTFLEDHQLSVIHHQFFPLRFGTLFARFFYILNLT